MAKPAYQRPPTPILARDAWKRGFLTPHDLFRIGAWKSAKGLAWLTINSVVDIEMVTRDAMKAIASWRDTPILGVDDDTFWAEWRDAAATAIGTKPKSGLMRLIGIRYPMAAAILCTLDGERWPVVDHWSIETVFGRSNFNWHRACVYEVFGRHLAVHGPAAWGQRSSIHELDQAAMRASMPGGSTPSSWKYAAIPTRPRRTRGRGESLK